jgi:hypothetical protein
MVESAHNFHIDPTLPPERRGSEGNLTYHTRAKGPVWVHQQPRRSNALDPAAAFEPPTAGVVIGRQGRSAPFSGVGGHRRAGRAPSPTAGACDPAPVRELEIAPRLH